MSEWFIDAVLKTVGGGSHPGVRIPLSPPNLGTDPRFFFGRLAEW